MTFQNLDWILAIGGLVSALLSLSATFWIGTSAFRQRKVGRAMLAKTFLVMSAALATAAAVATFDENTGPRSRGTKKPLGNRRLAR